MGKCQLQKHPACTMPEDIVWLPVYWLDSHIHKIVVKMVIIRTAAGKRRSGICFRFNWFLCLFEFLCLLSSIHMNVNSQSLALRGNISELCRWQIFSLACMWACCTITRLRTRTWHSQEQSLKWKCLFSLMLCRVLRCLHKAFTMIITDIGWDTYW